MSPEELLAVARAWRDDDPDPETRAEVDELVAAAERGSAEALSDLSDRFGDALRFGTAGLRGEMAAGPNRMNRAVVIRTTAGLAAYLAAAGHRGEPVIVGYDARHHSARFAADAAAVLAAAGFRALLADRPLPTPVVAFGVTHLECCAGIQVTASHNPPRDNGYKVYLGDGAQIVPPVDADIAACIAAVDRASAVPRAGDVEGDGHGHGHGDPGVEGDGGGHRDGDGHGHDGHGHDGQGSPGIVLVGDDLIADYVAGAVAQATAPGARDVRIVYTPLHGVGRDVLAAVLTGAGFAPPVLVPEQAEPDPDFPTVAFPNPEEPGALDLALALAAEREADVVVANDPDADRLAVAVPDAAGRWRALTGDEIGIVLADWLLSRGTGADRLVETTVVSSSMLERLAAARGVAFAETLTGFKWLARAALDRPDLRFVYAYEEALGSCVGTLVRDKDGITAALAFAELVAMEKRAGRTVLDRLDDLARELGVHATGQRSVRLTGSGGTARMQAVVDSLVASPPDTLASVPVEVVEDLRRGARLPPTDGVVLRGAGVRLIVRPSGTEPKLKCYAEAVVPVGGDVDLAAARARGAATVTALLDQAVSLVG